MPVLSIVMGDLQTYFFFNVHTTRSLRSGFGPTFLFPTATDNSIGADKWALGKSLKGNQDQ